jgi:hypothetical protein
LLSACNGCSRIGTAKGRRILAFELCVQAPIKQDHEAKTGPLQDFPLARPRIPIFPRRMIQPISSIGKTTMQLRKELISGVVVPVKSRGLRQTKVCQTETQQGEACL